MKVIVNKKKTIYMLSVIVIVLVLSLLCLNIFFSNSISKAEINALSKYPFLEEVCSLEKKGLNLKVSCKAFLYKVEIKENEETCFGMDFLTENYLFDANEICESSNMVSWDKNSMISDQKVPLNIEINYGGNFPGKYDLKNISLSIIEDSELMDILKKISSNNINVSNVRTQLSYDLELKGYYLSDDLNITEENSLSRVIFFNGKIESVTTQGEMIEIKMDILKNSNTYPITVRSKYIPVLGTSPGGIMVYDHSNFNSIETSSSYQILFYYVPLTSNVTKEQVSTYCQSDEILKEYTALCNLFPEIQIENIKIGDVEEYIDDVFTNNNSEQVVLDKLLFGTLIQK